MSKETLTDQDESLDVIKSYLDQLNTAIGVLTKAIRQDADGQQVAETTAAVVQLATFLSMAPQSLPQPVCQFFAEKSQALQEASKNLRGLLDVSITNRHEYRRKIYYTIEHSIGELRGHIAALLSRLNDTKDSSRTTDQSILESLKLQNDEQVNRNRNLETRLTILSDQNILLKRTVEEASAENKKLVEELLSLRDESVQATIKDNTNEFVEMALVALETSRKDFSIYAACWSIAALVTFVFGICLTFGFAIAGGEELVKNKDIQWSLIAFFSVKGAIFLGLLIGIVKFCAGQGRSYMHESLKSAERKHAIHYGKFYMSVFGAGAGAENVKEAFVHWNISTTSAFLSERERQGDKDHQTQITETLATKLIDKIPSFTPEKAS